MPNSLFAHEYHYIILQIIITWAWIYLLFNIFYINGDMKTYKILYLLYNINFGEDQAEWKSARAYAPLIQDQHL